MKAEKEYIERGALKQVIEERMTRVAEKTGRLESPLIQGYLLGKDHALDWVNAVPDDLVLVMCKNCKHARPIFFGCYYECRRYRVCRKADDFCSRGERRKQTDGTDNTKDHTRND